MDSICEKLLVDFSPWMIKIFEKVFEMQYLQSSSGNITNDFI